MDKGASHDSVMAEDLEHTTTLQSEGVGEVRPKKHFGMLAALGVQFSVTGTPLSIGAYLSLAIGAGGSAGYFWGFVLVGVFQLTTCLAVAELASAIPHSSGPAHWVLVLAPPRYRRTLSYVVGWVTTSAWVLIAAASYLYPSQLLLAIVSAAHPDYVQKSWHVYLVYCAFALVCLSINLPYTFKTVNWLLMFGVFAFNGTAIYYLITLLVRATPKATAHDVFVKFVNQTGWSSDGMVFFLGLLPAFAALGAFDNVTHLTDEMENPGKQIPLVMIGSFLLSFFVGIPMIIVYLFCNVNPDSLLDPIGGQPIVQLLVNAHRSLPLSIVGITFLVCSFFIAAAATLISVSRLYWSFSREGLLPFNGTMCKLSSRDGLPINALVFITLLTLVIGTIDLGSSIAMNAILGGAGICLVTSMCMAIALALLRGRSTLDTKRWLNLGFWGTPIYILSILWSTFISIFLCFPLYLPVTPEGMNYTSVIFVGLLVLAGLYWVFAFSKKAVTNHGNGGHDSDI